MALKWNVSSIVLNSLSLTTGERVVAVDVAAVAAVVGVAADFGDVLRIPLPFGSRGRFQDGVAVFEFVAVWLQHGCADDPWRHEEDLDCLCNSWCYLKLVPNFVVSVQFDG